MAFAGAYEQLGGLLRQLDTVSDAFRNGGGVRLDQFDEDVFRGMRRGSASWHDHLLVQQWIPLVPGLSDRLRQGMRCSTSAVGKDGRRSVSPRYRGSTFVGVDVHGPNVDAAREAAVTAGVADRVEFRHADATTCRLGTFDLVTAFDVVHDAADPAAMVSAPCATGRASCTA